MTLTRNWIAGGLKPCFQSLKAAFKHSSARRVGASQVDTVTGQACFLLRREEPSAKTSSSQRRRPTPSRSCRPDQCYIPFETGSLQKAVVAQIKTQTAV